MENASTEISLVLHSYLVEEVVDHLPVVIFTKYNMDADKPVSVVNCQPVRFIGVSTSQVRTGSRKGSRDPEISIAVITTVGVPVEKHLADIIIKSVNVVINMKCNGMASWVSSLGEVWPTQSVDQWVYWITNPPSREDVPNIDWLIAVFPVTSKTKVG